MKITEKMFKILKESFEDAIDNTNYMDNDEVMKILFEEICEIFEIENGEDFEDCFSDEDEDDDWD